MIACHDHHNTLIYKRSKGAGDPGQVHPQIHQSAKRPMRHGQLIQSLLPFPKRAVLWHYAFNCIVQNSQRIPPSFNFIGKPQATNTTSSAARAMAWLHDPIKSRKSHASRFSGTIPEPTSLVTKIIGPKQKSMLRPVLGLYSHLLRTMLVPVPEPCN